MLGDAQDTVYGFSDFEGPMTEIAPNFPGLVQASNQSGESWIQTASRLASTLVGTWQQKELMDIQLDRAARGLPPLNITDYSGLGVNVGLSKGTQQALLIGVGILAGAYLLPQLLRGR